MLINDKTKKKVRDRQWRRCARCGVPMMGSEPRALKINVDLGLTADNLVMLCRTCHPVAKIDFNCTHVPHLPERTYRYFYGHR